MSTIEEMTIERVFRDQTDWDTIIREADEHIGPQSGVIIIKHADLPDPGDHFRDISFSGLSSFPERYGLEFSFSSWRIRDYPGKGYHIHEFEGFYLLHRDTYDPKDLFSTIRHLIHDTSTTEKIIAGGLAGFILWQFLKKGK